MDRTQDLRLRADRDYWWDVLHDVSLPISGVLFGGTRHEAIYVVALHEALPCDICSVATFVAGVHHCHVPLSRATLHEPGVAQPVTCTLQTRKRSVALIYKCLMPIKSPAV